MFSTAKKRSTLLENNGIEYELVYVGFLEKTHLLPACLSSKKSALPSTMPSWAAWIPIPESLKTVCLCVKLCSSAERQASRRLTPTLNTHTDQKQILIIPY